MKKQREIRSIIERNTRVEADKAWETSKTRRTTIALLTYLIVVAFLYSIDAERPWLMALIPVAGFILSTLLIVPLKKWWLAKLHSGKKTHR